MVRVKVSVLFVLQVLATAIVPALARPTQPPAKSSSPSSSLPHQQLEEPQTGGPSPSMSSSPPRQGGHQLSPDLMTTDKLITTARNLSQKLITIVFPRLKDERARRQVHDQVETGGLDHLSPEDMTTDKLITTARNLLELEHDPVALDHSSSMPEDLQVTTMHTRRIEESQNLIMIVFARLEGASERASSQVHDQVETGASGLDHLSPEEPNQKLKEANEILKTIIRQWNDLQSGRYHLPSHDGTGGNVSGSASVETDKKSSVFKGLSEKALQVKRRWQGYHRLT